MIDINCTIIIQMINFFIGFLLLKYLLFKPAIKHIIEQEKIETAMLERISTHKHVLDIKLDEKNRIWQNYEKYFKINKPKKTLPEIKKFEETQVETYATEISKKEIEMLAIHAQKALTERINRGGK